jgi:hypothetical protein
METPASRNYRSFGRNCLVFERARQFAYAEWRGLRFSDVDRLFDGVFDFAMGINQAFRVPMQPIVRKRAFSAFRVHTFPGKALKGPTRARYTPSLRVFSGGRPNPQGARGMPSQAAAFHDMASAQAGAVRRPLSSLPHAAGLPPAQEKRRGLLPPLPLVALVVTPFINPLNGGTLPLSTS